MNKRDRKRAIAVFGYGNTGARTAARMRERGFDVTIFDADDSATNRAREDGFQAQQLDTTAHRDLIASGVATHYSEVICCLPSDPDNLFLILSLRALSQSMSIVSVIRANELATQFIDAGANKTIDPYSISGRKIAAQIQRPIAAEIIEKVVMARNDLQLAEVQVMAGQKLDHSTLQALQLEQQFNLIVIGILDRQVSGEFHFVHQGSDPHLDAGDVLVVIGLPGEVQRLQQWARG